MANERLEIIIRAKVADAINKMKRVGDAAIASGRKAVRSAAGWRHLGNEKRTFAARSTMAARALRKNIDATVASGRAAIAAAGGFSGLRQSMSQLVSTARGVGTALTKYVTLPLVALGVLSVRSFAKFDGAMTRSLAIMGDVSTQMRQDMTSLAQDLSTQSTFAARELGEAYFYLASAGYTAQQSLRALPIVTRFGQAGTFNLSRATELLGDAQVALGMKVADAGENMKNMTRISDVLVGANTLATQTTEQFALGLARSGASLRQFGVDLNEGVALLAIYAANTMKAETGGEALGRLLRLLVPAANENAEAYKKLGIRVFDSAGNLNLMADIIKDMEKALEGMSVKQRSATLEQLGFQKRMQQVILPLLGASGVIKEYTERTKNLGGIAKEVADKQLTAFGAKFKILANRADVAAQRLGKILTPHVLALADSMVGKLEELTNWFGSLSEKERESVVQTALLAAALGPAIIGLTSLAFAFNNAMLAAMGLHKIMLVLHGVVIGSTTALGLLLNALAVVAVAAAGFAIGSLIAKYTELDEKIADVINKHLWLEKLLTGMDIAAEREKVETAREKVIRRAQEEGLALTETQFGGLQAFKTREEAEAEIARRGGRLLFGEREGPEPGPERMEPGPVININGPVNAFGARNMQEILQRDPQVAIAGPGGA